MLGTGFMASRIDCRASGTDGGIGVLWHPQLLLFRKDRLWAMFRTMAHLRYGIGDIYWKQEQCGLPLRRIKSAR